MSESVDFQQLYEKARQGELNAQESLLSLVQPRLLAFLNRRMGSDARRFTEPEDLAQSALLDLLERIDRFPEDLDETEFIAFALQLGRWRLANIFKRKHHDEGASKIPGSTPAPESQTGIVTREDDKAWTRGLILSLDDMYATVLEAYHVRGLSVAEIAAEFSLSRETVKQRLVRGRNMLRERMAREWSARSR